MLVLACVRACLCVHACARYMHFVRACVCACVRARLHASQDSGVCSFRRRPSQRTPSNHATCPSLRRLLGRSWLPRNSSSKTRMYEFTQDVEAALAKRKTSLKGSVASSQGKGGGWDSREDHGPRGTAAAGEEFMGSCTLQKQQQQGRNNH